VSDDREPTNVIKLVALLAADRLLRPLVTIAIVATLAMLHLTGTQHPADQGRNAVGQLQNAARPLDQLLRHALQTAIAP
jgi:hypothetical protein